MRGWRRLIIVLLIGWWGWCGFVAVNAGLELRRLSHSWDFLDENMAAQQMSDATLDDESRRDARNYLEAHAQIRRSIAGAIAVPLIAAGLFVIGRWVMLGFRRPSDL